MPKRAINPSGLPPPPKFSRGVEVSGAGRTVYIAGAAPLNPDGSVAGVGDMRSQAEACYGKIAQIAQIAQIVEEAGGAMSDIVFLTMHVTGLVSRTPGLWGPPNYVAARLRDLGRRGLDRWLFYTGGADIDRSTWIDSFSSEVIPLLET